MNLRDKTREFFLGEYIFIIRISFSLYWMQFFFLLCFLDTQYAEKCWIIQYFAIHLPARLPQTGVSFICSRILEIPRASQIFCIWGDTVGVSFKLHLNFCMRVIQTCPSFLSFPFNFSNILKPWFHLLEVGLAHKLFLSNFEYISDQINLHQRKIKT